MQYRALGKTGLAVSEVGFGCARIGGVFQGSSRRQTLDLLRHAADEGINLFDTADMYTQGESERLIGEAFRRDRHRVIIATKFGFKLPAQKHIISRIKPLVKPLVVHLGLKPRHVHATVRGTVSQQDFSRQYIFEAVESSLRRLQTEYIDIYQLHSPPTDVLQRAEFVEALESLRAQGKIRYWGVACEHADDVLTSLRFAGLSTVQVGLSALEQAALDSAIPRAAEEGVGIIARQVYASGLLTRPVDRLPAAHEIDADPVVGERKLAQIERFGALALEHRRDRAELALQFALSVREIATVLLGVSRREQLDASLHALQSATLRPDEYRLILNTRRVGR